MQTDSLMIPTLFFFLFVAVIALAMYQSSKAKRDVAPPHRSAQTKVYGEKPGDRQSSVLGSSATLRPQETAQRPVSPAEPPIEHQDGVFGSSATVTTEEITRRPFLPG